MVRVVFLGDRPLSLAAVAMNNNSNTIIDIAINYRIALNPYNRMNRIDHKK